MKSKHFYSLLFRKILGDQLQFSVREIRTLDFCNQEECKNEEFFLDEFGRTIQKTSEPVCLAHIFTYRDFPGGYQGHNESIQFFKEHSYLYGLAFSQKNFEFELDSTTNSFSSTIKMYCLFWLFFKLALLFVKKYKKNNKNWNLYVVNSDKQPN